MDPCKVSDTMASWAAAEPKATVSSLDSVNDVEIDEEGVFKYVLISVSDKETGKTKHVVRGHAWAAYHDDVFQAAKSDIRGLSANLHAVCVGGGRIRHEPAGHGTVSKIAADAAAIAAAAGDDPLNPKPVAPTAAAAAGGSGEPAAAAGSSSAAATSSSTGGHILVYGYSVGYGRADHSLACEALRRAFPTYTVEWSDDGY